MNEQSGRLVAVLEFRVPIMQVSAVLVVRIAMMNDRATTDHKGWRGDERMSAGSQDWAGLLVEAIEDLQQDGPALLRDQRALCMLAAAAAMFANISMGFGSLIGSLAFWFTTCLLAVVWHRGFILGEPFGQAGRPLPRLARSYFVGCLIIGAIAVPLMLIALPIFLMPFVGDSEINLIAPPMSVNLLMTLIVNGIVASLCLTLPARALERPMALKESLAATSGNRSHLALALSAVTVPSIGVAQLDLWVRNSDMLLGGVLTLITGAATAICVLGTVGLEIALINRAYMRIKADTGILGIVGPE